MLDVSYEERVRCPARSAHCRQPQGRDYISTSPVVLPHFLRIVHTSIQAGCIVLGEANESLQEDEDVKQEAEYCVRGSEVLVPWTGFVDLNDDQASEEGRNTDEIE